MNIEKLKNNKSLWGKAVFILAFFAVIICWRVKIFEVISMIQDRETVVEFLQQYGIWGPLILFFVLVLQVFLAVIPGHAFIVAGGYIYGLFIGVVLTQVSTVLASQLAFLLTRRFGRPLVDRFAPTNVIDHWNKLAATQGTLFFFFAFILPIFPNDLMSFIAGLGSISSRKFFVANFFGRLPCAIFVTLIGSHGLEMPLYFWAVVVFVILGLCISWKFISPYIEGRIINKTSSTSCLC